MTGILNPLANWRDPVVYPDPANATYSQWAWEFLRRNSKYQSDYALYESLGGKRISLDVDKPVPHIVVCEPSALPRETYGQWKLRCSARRKIEMPISYFRSVYFVDYVVSPQRNECHPFMFSPARVTFSSYWKPEEGERLNHMEVESSDEIVVKVRLDVPIDVQLKAIKSLVEELPEYTPFNARLHIKKFPLYLRAFDGRIAGATAREIADVLGLEGEDIASRIDEKTVGNFWNAAERFVTSDYWKIAASSAPKK